MSDMYLYVLSACLFPLYLIDAQLRADMKRLGLNVQFCRVDTDQPVCTTPLSSPCTSQHCPRSRTPNATKARFLLMCARLPQARSCKSTLRASLTQPRHQVRVNAARLRHEIIEMSQEGFKVVLLGHSKGAVDAGAALSIFPELKDSVAALVSLQGPHGGSAIAHDLVHTNIQKSITLGAIEKLLRGCR